MSIKSIDDQFSAEMDNYLSSILISEEEKKELLELGKSLADKDFSRNSNKEAIYRKAQKNINMNRGESNMKRISKNRRIIAVVASLAVVFSITFMQTTFAQDLIQKIKASISLDHITAIQMESPPHEGTYLVPEELKGKLFDKDGKPIEKYTKDMEETFTSEGEKIAYISNGEIVTEAQKEKIEKIEMEKMLEIKNPDHLNKYTCFNVILPSYLPEGYAFDRALLYKDEEGNVDEKSEKYIDLYFTNKVTGKYLYMQQRFADEETGYEFSTDGEIEKVKINGVDAIIADGSSIDWEKAGVLYGLSGRGEIRKAELIKIAESIK